MSFHRPTELHIRPPPGLEEYGPCVESWSSGSSPQTPTPSVLSAGRDAWDADALASGVHSALWTKQQQALFASAWKQYPAGYLAHPTKPFKEDDLLRFQSQPVGSIRELLRTNGAAFVANMTQPQCAMPLSTTPPLTLLESSSGRYHMRTQMPPEVDKPQHAVASEAVERKGWMDADAVLLRIEQGCPIVQPEANFSRDARGEESNLADKHVAPTAAFSRGSIGHPHSCGGACRYVKRKGGCRHGDQCANCHSCFWRRDAGNRQNEHTRGSEGKSRNAEVGTVSDNTTNASVGPSVWRASGGLAQCNPRARPKVSEILAGRACHFSL